MTAGSPPSVLHVSQPTSGGVGCYVAAAGADQQARGWTVAVACPDHGPLVRDLDAHGVPRLSWAAGRTPRLAATSEALRLHRLIAAAQPDVVHLHSSKAGLAGRLALRGRLPTLFQPHGWSWLALSGPAVAAAVRWERRAARWTDALVCVGEGEAAQGRTQRVPGNYALVRNGVDLSRFRPTGHAGRAAARAMLGLEPAAPLAVCVGRVCRQKGQDALLEAWPRVTTRHPTATLAVVGDGDLLPALRQRAPAGVRFAGAVDDARPWYAAADVVVLPSRWEGLSLSLLEALASARPVVATAVAGLADELPPEAGAVVGVDDPAQLADAIAGRFDSPERAREEGRAAARAAAGHDLRDTLDRLAELTAEIAEMAAARRAATAAAVWRR
jgi:glycosyltransferase involved in cell wall biosynthesis